jgi:MtN3 and saliva related transmembrane protein
MNPFRADGAVMATATWIIVVGTVAGLCTTFAFVPQVVKIWKQGGRDLSYGMLALYLIGAILWFIYGVLLHAQAVIITNFATAIVIAFATAMKAWTARRDECFRQLDLAPFDLFFWPHPLVIHYCAPGRSEVLWRP